MHGIFLRVFLVANHLISTTTIELESDSVTVSDLLTDE